MDDLIKDELEELLKDWKEGRRMQVIPLGHSTRVNERGHQVRHTFRQLQAYAYCFEIIEASLENPPESWEMFCMIASTLAPPELTREEREAAESLAWKALRRGWQHGAVSGFSEEHSIRIMRRGVDA